MGITTVVYQALIPNSEIWGSLVFKFTTLYLSLSLSLNVLLTLMIVIRLVLHSRNIRALMGTPGGITGLYKTIITMLIESCALYTVSSLLVIGQSRAAIVDIFFPILAETQVRVFPQPRQSGRLCNVMMDWTGHRPTARHSTCRQPERTDKRDHRHREHWFDQL